MKKVLIGLVAIIVLMALIILGVGLLAPPYSETTTIEVDAPVDVAFAIFNDPNNMTKWMNTDQMQFKSIENISGNENEVGSKWKMVMKEGGREIEMIETVLAFEENKRFAFNIKDQYADFDIEITFEEKDGKTIITEYNTEGEGLGIFSKAMVTLFSGSLRDTKQQMYGQLKNLIEER